MNDLFYYNGKGAIISDCGHYRYRLWRIWDEAKPKVLWIMLNPSKADGQKDDNTIRRCIAFTKSWGYGGMYVGNLFAYRATKPRDLRPLMSWQLIKDENAEHIEDMSKLCDLHILAYGSHNIHLDIGGLFLIRGQLKLTGVNWHCLKMTAEGHPAHPLFLPKDLKPIPYTPPFIFP